MRARSFSADALPAPDSAPCLLADEQNVLGGPANAAAARAGPHIRLGSSMGCVSLLKDFGPFSFYGARATLARDTRTVAVRDRQLRKV